jgi:predicted nucleic acid-binding protein
MYVLDTKVLSEIMKEAPDPGVVKWLSACPADAMFTTAVCHTEILYGVRRMPDGQKRYRLTAAAQAMFAQEFAGRVLPFDEAAASVYADIRIARERAGRPLTVEDGMIAAITKVVGANVVTRDSAGFAGCGVPVINPWEQAG